MWGWLHLHHIGASLNGGHGLDRVVKLIYDSLVTPKPKLKFGANKDIWVYVQFEGYGMWKGLHQAAVCPHPRKGHSEYAIPLW